MVLLFFWRIDDKKISFWNFPTFIENITLAFGITDLNDLKKPQLIKGKRIEIRTIKNVTPHPLYQFPKAYNDVLIVEIDQPVPFHKTIYPLCLPDEPNSDPDFYNR